MKQLPKIKVDDVFKLFYEITSSGMGDPSEFFEMFTKYMVKSNTNSIIDCIGASLTTPELTNKMWIELSNFKEKYKIQ